MRYLAPACLLIAALIHLLPLVGVLGPERLAALYGLVVDEPNLQILMRHRAVLFGIVGGLLLAAVFMPALRIVALATGLISVLSFLALAWQVGGANAQIARVVMVDWIALAALLLGSAAELAMARRIA
jgi:hypothetical protein